MRAYAWCGDDLHHPVERSNTESRHRRSSFSWLVCLECHGGERASLPPLRYISLSPGQLQPSFDPRISWLHIPFLPSHHLIGEVPGASISGLRHPNVTWRPSHVPGSGDFSFRSGSRRPSARRAQPPPTHNYALAAGITDSLTHRSSSPPRPFGVQTVIRSAMRHYSPRYPPTPTMATTSPPPTGKMEASVAARPIAIDPL